MAPAHLVDTNVISELARPAPAAVVLEWAASVHAICISAITVDEVEYGLAARPHPRVQRWWQRFFDQRCAVLAVTEDIARRAGWLRGDLRKRGHTRTQADMLIAATAQLHGLTLVTRNLKDFTDCGIPLIDPFVVS